MYEVILTEPELRVFSSVVRNLLRQFRLVDRDDLKQELAIWVITHDKTMERFREKSERECVSMLRKSLYRQGRRYCHQETAKIVGYRVEDLFFYSLPLLEELLTQHYHPGSPLGEPELDHKRGPKAPRSAAEGGNRMAMLADIAIGLPKLYEADRALLERFYRDGESGHYLAEEWKVSEPAVTKRKQRALRHLQAVLGGANPGFSVES